MKKTCNEVPYLVKLQALACKLHTKNRTPLIFISIKFQITNFKVYSDLRYAPQL